MTLLDFSKKQLNQAISKGDICYVKLNEKPLKDERYFFLRGERPCLVLSIMDNTAAYILPLTHSKDYASSEFIFTLKDERESYPRFDMVLPVPLNALYGKNYNLILNFGQDIFDNIINYYLGVLKGEIIVPCFIPETPKSIALYREESSQMKTFSSKTETINNGLQKVSTEETIVSSNKKEAIQISNDVQVAAPLNVFDKFIQDYDTQLKAQRKTLSPKLKDLETKYGYEFIYETLTSMKTIDVKDFFSISLTLTNELRMRYGIGKRRFKDCTGDAENNTQPAIKTFDSLNYNQGFPKSIIMFLREKTEIKYGRSTPICDLFNEYADYSKSKKYTPVNKDVFKVCILKTGIQKCMSSSGHDIFKDIILLK